MAPHANMRSRRAPGNERRSASQLRRPLNVGGGGTRKGERKRNRLYRTSGREWSEHLKVVGVAAAQ